MPFLVQIEQLHSPTVDCSRSTRMRNRTRPQWQPPSYVCSISRLPCDDGQKIESSTEIGALISLNSTSTKFLAVSGEFLAGQIDPFTVVLDHPANDLRAPAVALQNCERCVTIPFGDENTKPDPHIEYLEHFGIGDRATLLNEAKDRGRRRQVIDL